MSPDAESSQSDYVIICSDTFDLDDRRFDAWSLAQYRMAKKYWPFYNNTRNRKAISDGDRFILYLAGQGSMAKNFVAVGEFDKLLPRNAFKEEDDLGIISGNPDKIRALRNIRGLEPISVQKALPLLGAYNRMANPVRWGALFIGGARRLEQGEYTEITCCE